MRKWIISLIMLLCFVYAIPVIAAPTVFVESQQLSFDVPPVIENGHTLVPLRAIFEALGANVTWDESTQTVMSTKQTLQENINVKLNIGQTTAYRNGSPVPLDVPAKIIDGRTMVPLPFVSHALSVVVAQDCTTGQIIKIGGYIPPCGTIPLPPQ